MDLLCSFSSSVEKKKKNKNMQILIGLFKTKVNIQSKYSYTFMTFFTNLMTIGRNHAKTAYDKLLEANVRNGMFVVCLGLV